MATGSNMRVGDAERDTIAAQLRDAYGDGRLTLDELNERLDQTLRARTAADLAAVTRDLPSVGSPWASATGGTARLTGQGDQAQPHGQAQWGNQSQWGAPGDQGNGSGSGRRGFSAMASAVPVLLAMWGLLILAGLLVFGVGGGRPFGFVLFFAALALLRRMFGRRRFGRRGGGRCGRRW